MDARDRLVLALDLESPRGCLELLGRVGDRIGRVKVGPRIFALGGLGFIRELVDGGYRVFLDLKLHDIPNTVALAVEALASHRIWALTVHAAGGFEMMRRAVECRGDMDILAVTVLTSLGEDVWAQVSPGCPMGDAIAYRARLAHRAGVQGLVCSPLDLEIVTSAAPGLATVVPGIRFQGGEVHDQARVMGPREAVASGASFLVVGRAILESPDPAGTIESMVEMMEVGN